VNIGNDGGPLDTACPTTRADGYRIYPPHSAKSVYVAAKGLTACSNAQVWMRIRPVAADEGGTGSG
jgi:hypothetical protein